VPNPAPTGTQTIKACMKNSPNTCGTFDLVLVPQVTIASSGPWLAGTTNNVTITGNNFGTSPLVSLGNAALVPSIGAVSNTSIALQVYVPVSFGGQTLTITVTNQSTGLSPPPSASANALVTKATIAINPPSATLRESQTQTFVSTCTAGGGACTGQNAVTWTATAGGVAPSGPSGATMTYTAPASVASNTQVTITACWAAGQCATAQVTVTPITVAVTPSPVNVNGCTTRQFNAQVSNAPATTVNWELIPQVGAIDNNGLYTAPCPVTAQHIMLRTEACEMASPAMQRPATSRFSTRRGTSAP